MAAKIPPLLHKMSPSSQKAWYKKNKMELPAHLTSKNKEGKSAAQAKKDVGEINKQKAKEKTALQKALETSPKQKELKKSSERVRQMASNALAFGGQRPGGDLTTSRGIVSYIRGGGYLKAGRLGEAAKPDASMAMTDQLKKKMITDKDKRTLGKVAALMASAKNKDKKNEYVRQLGLKAMKAGKVDPARGYVPTRVGREELKKEGFDPSPSDIAAELVKKHGKGKVTSKHLDAYEGDRDTRRGLDREAIMQHVKKLSEETVNEVSKTEAEKVLGGAVKQKPKMPPGKQPAGYRYVRGLARKALKASLKKEEVEQVDEAKGEPPAEFMPSDTKLPRIKVPAKPKPGVRKRGPVGSFNKKGFWNPGVREEVEQIDEVKQGKEYTKQQLVNKMKAGNWETSYDIKPGKHVELTHRSGKKVSVYVKEEIEESTMKYIEEKLTAADPASKWISDFVKSDNPKFAGKSKKERIQQALGAYYAAKRGTNEEVEQADESYEGKGNHKPGWMLRADPKLAKKLKTKTDLAKKRQATYGNPAAGKKANEEVEQIDEVSSKKSEKFDITKHSYEPKIHPRGEHEDYATHPAHNKPDAVVKVADGATAHIFHNYDFKKGVGHGKHTYVRKNDGDDDYVYHNQPKVPAAKVKHDFTNLDEEVGGKTPETKTEVELAKKHGDPKKITYGDVIKARIASAKKKVMGKGE